MWEGNWERMDRIREGEKSLWEGGTIGGKKNRIIEVSK